MGRALEADARPGRRRRHDAASFPFLEHLAGPQRIVITATDSVAQRFDTVFPEYFVRALTDPAADLDKNGRVSVWEAFAAASMGVRRYYTQRGQLATERALIDDNGDGVGREAGATATTARARAACIWIPTSPARRRPTRSCSHCCRSAPRSRSTWTS